MAGRRNQYRPDYPSTLTGYIRMLRQAKAEHAGIAGNSCSSGYRLALQMAIGMANDLKRNLKKGEYEESKVKRPGKVG